MNKPILRQLSDVEPREVSWLWPGRIPRGRITLIAGDPGLGKSWATLDMAARVSIGRDWPDGHPCIAGNVLLLNCEDDVNDTIKPRLDLLGADTRRIWQLDAMETGHDFAGKPVSIPVTLDHVEAIRLAMSITEARLCIIDPVTGFFGSGADSNRDTYIRQVFRPLAAIAEAQSCAVVIVAHLNKSSDQAALYRFSGSVQFSGASRVAYYIGRDRADSGRRLMMCVKNNLGPDRWAMAYRVDPEHESDPIQWEPEEITSESLEDIVSGGRESEDVREISEWLKRKVVGDRGIPLGQIQKEVKQAGWTWLQVTRARRVLGIRQESVGGEWYWLPENADPTRGRGWSDAD